MQQPLEFVVASIEKRKTVDFSRKTSPEKFESANQLIENNSGLVKIHDAADNFRQSQSPE